MDNPVLTIAKLIGEPVATQLPVPFELAAIADVFTAEAGEHVWRYATLDSTADVVLAVDTTDGAVTVVKRTALDDVELSFTDLNSKQEYVLLSDVLNKPDTDALSRRRESLTRGMDKRELQLIINALDAETAGYMPGVGPQTYTPASADDLWDCIVGMKHLVEDYGDGYVLLVGSTVSNAIDTYDKDKVGSHMYRIGMKETLSKLGIEVIKVFGNVSSASNETETAIMNAEKAILIAKNSRISEGKPIKFVRRKIPANIAEAMGAKVDNAQRGLFVIPYPQNISGTNTAGFGVYAYESVIFCVTNPYMIVNCDMSGIV